jgi:hypothetical protein
VTDRAADQRERREVDAMPTVPGRNLWSPFVLRLA